jgi:hypothetical protein
MTYSTNAAGAVSPGFDLERPRSALSAKRPGRIQIGTAVASVCHFASTLIAEAVHGGAQAASEFRSVGATRSDTGKHTQSPLAPEATSCHFCNHLATCIGMRVTKSRYSGAGRDPPSKSRITPAGGCSSRRVPGCGAPCDAAVPNSDLAPGSEAQPTFAGGVRRRTWAPRRYAVVYSAAAEKALVQASPSA